MKRYVREMANDIQKMVAHLQNDRPDIWKKYYYGAENIVWFCINGVFTNKEAVQALLNLWNELEGEIACRN